MTSTGFLGKQTSKHFFTTRSDGSDDYKNIFINATDLNFAGTGLFFKNHGYEELYGKKEFEKMSYNFNGQTWGGGPHDSFLFKFAKQKVKEFRNTKIDFQILKPRFGFMINNYALTIEKVLNGQVDKLIIAPIFGFALLGNYALSIQFLSIMLIIPSIVFQYTLSQDATGNLSKKIKKMM